MANDATEVLVAQQAKIYIADAEETLPTGVAAPSGNFVELGYTSTDGLSVSFEPTVEDIFAHQDLDPIRQVNTARTFQITFNQMQWNEDTFALAFGGGTWSLSTGVYTYSPPDTGDAVPEYTLIADVEDGNKKKRFVIRRGSVNGAVETTLVNNTAAVMPITIRALKASGSSKAWEYRTDDASYGS